MFYKLFVVYCTLSLMPERRNIPSKIFYHIPGNGAIERVIVLKKSINKFYLLQGCRKCSITKATCIFCAFQLPCCFARCSLQYLKTHLLGTYESMKERNHL